MKVTEIRRPEILKLDELGLKFEVTAPRNLNNNQTDELIDIMIAPTLIYSEKKNEEGKFAVLFDEKILSDKIYEDFNRFTYSIGKMVRLAELNLDTLRGVIGSYLHINGLENLLARNAACRALSQYDIQNEFQKLTFGNLRNILSCIVKTDAEIQAIEELNTSENRSNFTAVYNNYIEDRDRYTHGILFFLYPTMDPVLRVKANEGVNEYVRYEKIVFTHNLMTYNYLDRVLRQIQKLLNGKLAEKELI